MGALDGQVVLVTGGTRGIGHAISERMLAAGAQVAAGYSRDEEAAKRFAAEYGPNVSVHKGNIGSNDDCVRVVNDVIGEHGKIDVLVNNAGITADRTVRKMAPADWDRVIQINLSGTFYMSHAVIQHMLDRRSGRIINISSVIGEMGNIGQANYAAAKSGLFGLTKTLALETARHGVTVNAVTPGYIETEMVATMPSHVLEGAIAQIPMRRLGKPEEVARVVEFLAEPGSVYITGEIYGINGGLYM